MCYNSITVKGKGKQAKTYVIWWPIPNGVTRMDRHSRIAVATLEEIFSKNFEKTLDFYRKVCYNKTTVREGKPNKPERIWYYE